MRPERLAMPQVNLSALNGQELRHLLDASRRRGDASLSYKVLQEMAARREAPGERRPSKGRRPAEPRVIAVDLGDPMEAPADDVPPMPNWRPPAREDRAGDLKTAPGAAVRPGRREPIAAPHARDAAGGLPLRPRPIGAGSPSRWTRRRFRCPRRRTTSTGR